MFWFHCFFLFIFPSSSSSAFATICQRNVWLVAPSKVFGYLKKEKKFRHWIHSVYVTKMGFEKLKTPMPINSNMYVSLRFIFCVCVHVYINSMLLGWFTPASASPSSSSPTNMSIELFNLFTCVSWRRQWRCWRCKHQYQYIQTIQPFIFLAHFHCVHSSVEEHFLNNHNSTLNMVFFCAKPKRAINELGYFTNLSTIYHRKFSCCHVERTKTIKYTHLDV